MRRLAALFFGLTLGFQVVAVTAAQEVKRRVAEPAPLAASDPQAVRTAALVKHLLAGDKAQAVALLGKEADEAYVKKGTLEKDIEAQIKRLSTGKFTIKEFEQGFGADVVVFLANDKGEETNLVVRYNGDKRITGFAEAKIVR